jgi:hypothetical protein
MNDNRLVKIAENEKSDTPKLPPKAWYESWTSIGTLNKV